MSALDVIQRVCSNDHLMSEDLKYCLVDETKKPHKIDGNLARPNSIDDFVDISTLLECQTLEEYAGIGLSIQASNICAIDVDKCFSSQFEVSSGDDRAKEILDKFKDCAYCEFSFSGKGLRVLFKHPLIDDYSERYYIKNEKFGLEFYQPSSSFRYVTLTGRTLANSSLDNVDEDSFKWFLNTYMLRPVRQKQKITSQQIETRSFEEVFREIKLLYFKNSTFQNLWFGHAPGSGKNESELDFQLLAMMYENITQEAEYLQRLFESSPYFHTKDFKHLNKWKNQENRYFKYMYSILERRH